jgi:ferredoxin-nitrite reductase
LSKFSEEFLAIWTLANLESNKTIKLGPTDSGFLYEKALLMTHFSDVDFIEPIEEDFSHSISAMAKKLWTVEGEDPTYKPSIDRVKFR